MDCETFGPMISTLFDGEDVPAEAGRHILNCTNCRGKLAGYTAMAVEIRLLAAQERETLKMPATAERLPLPVRSSLGLALRKRMRVPRFAAAICGLLIVVLAAGWAKTRAQAAPQWFQYKFTAQGHNRGSSSVGGVIRACSSACGQSMMLSSGAYHIGIMLHVWKIDRHNVYLTVRTKQFAAPQDNESLSREMAGIPAVQYVYRAGEPLRIPVSGTENVKMEGIIAASDEGVPWWFDAPIQPGENEIAVHKGVLIQDGRVIAEMIGSGWAAGKPGESNPGFFAYVPQYGLFAVGLKPFSGAIEGSADYGQLRFTENGAKYMLLSGSQITGGTQPRTVWILHSPGYLPSEHERQGDGSEQFGTTSNIVGVLKNMGAVPE